MTDADFYAEHYPDWTVHALPLTVYIPTKDMDAAEALDLVREILSGAGFDIRVSSTDDVAQQARKIADAYDNRPHQSAQDVVNTIRAVFP